jgi:cytochrome c553
MKSKWLLVMMFSLAFIPGLVQAGGDVARGQELSVDCADCHGEDGKGDDEFPALAGMPADKQIAALKAYASGEMIDDSDMMGDIASELTEQDMADLAAYYASLK